MLVNWFGHILRQNYLIRNITREDKKDKKKKDNSYGLYKRKFMQGNERENIEQSEMDVHAQINMSWTCCKTEDYVSVNKFLLLY